MNRPEGCTFLEEDWNILSRGWFPVAVSADLTVAPVAARLLDVALVVFRSGGKAVVALDRCPHRGVLLSKGRVEEDEIVCPYHGLHFAGGGQCTAIPSDPTALIPRSLALTVLPSLERFGLIWTTLRGEAPLLPEFEAGEDPDYQLIVPPVIDIVGSIGRQMEGFLDVAHFAWAHLGSFGDSSNPVVPSYKVETTPRGFRATYVSTVSNYPPALQHLAPRGFLWGRVFDVFLPFAARLVVHFPGAARLWILNVPSPMSARQTRLFSPVARNFDKDGSVQAVHDFNRTVFAEDKAMIEMQRPLDLPLDPGDEAHIPADRSSIAYRRLLKQMGLTLRAAMPS